MFIEKQGKTMEFEPAELTEKFEKLREYEKYLKGKELQLKKREEALNEREFLLKSYRKNILTAIKTQIRDSHSYEDSVKILNKYRDILQFVVKDVQDDLDDLMV